jgi:hypothetical protein
MSEECVKRQVEILEAIEKAGGRVVDAWVSEPTIISVQPYKYVYYSMYIMEDCGKIFKVPLMKKVYIYDEIIEEKLYTTQEAHKYPSFFFFCFHL